MYLPKEIAGTPTFEASAPTVTGVEHEFGHPVAIGFLKVPAGGEMTWSVTYTVPNAITNIGADTVEYRMDFLPQPTFTPGPLNVTIHLPEGAVTQERSRAWTGARDAHLSRPAGRGPQRSGCVTDPRRGRRRSARIPTTSVREPPTRYHRTDALAASALTRSDACACR